MRGFLILSTEEEIETLKNRSYYGLKDDIKNRSIFNAIYDLLGGIELPDKIVPERFTIDKALDVYLDNEWEGFIDGLPFSNEKKFRDALKKDILCLCVLTCDYWKSKKDINKKTWDRGTFELDVEKISWKLDFDLWKEKNGLRTQSEDFLCKLKEMIIINPEVWIRGGEPARFYYRLDYIINHLYKFFSAEEKYVYQMITGFPIVLSLLKEPGEDGDEQKFIKCICEIKGLHVRQFYVEKFCNLESRNELLNKLSAWEKGTIHKVDIKMPFGTGAMDVVINTSINDILLSICRGFLKILSNDFGTDKDENSWEENLLGCLRRDCQILSDVFWLDNDYMEESAAIVSELLEHERGKKNQRAIQLQKDIMNLIISCHSSKNIDDVATNIQFPPKFDFDRICYVERAKGNKK